MNPTHAPNPCTQPVHHDPPPPSQPHRRYWDRWFMMGSIGVSVGIAAYLLNVVGARCVASGCVTLWLLVVSLCVLCLCHCVCSVHSV